MTEGLDVFVQLVIAATATDPLLNLSLDLLSPLNSLLNTDLTSFKKILSCGLLGPDKLGLTEPKSKSTILLYSGIQFSSWNINCSFE